MVRHAEAQMVEAVKGEVNEDLMAKIAACKDRMMND